MLDLEAGRHAAIRDLDATIFRLRDVVNLADWNRPTPCEGWEIRHMAAHLSSSIHNLATLVGQVIARRTGRPPTMEDALEVDAESDPARMVASLTQHRNMLFHTLAALEPADMTATARDAAPTLTGGRLLTVCCLECGLHRCDLEEAMGDPEAGVTTETVVAADDIRGSRLAEIAERSGAKPDAPVGFHLEGALLDRSLSWDGTQWRNEIGSVTNVVHIRGDDSSLALFLCGRVRADDDRLDVDGDMSEARRFNVYVPGP